MINLKKTLLYTLIPASFACGLYMQNVNAYEETLDPNDTKISTSTYEVTIPANTTIDASTQTGSLHIGGKVKEAIHQLQISVSSKNIDSTGKFNLTNGTTNIPYTIKDGNETITSSSVLKFPSGMFVYEDPTQYGTIDKTLTLSVDETSGVSYGNYEDLLTFTFTDVQCYEFNVGAYLTEDNNYVFGALSYELYIDGERFGGDTGTADLVLQYAPPGTTYEVKNITKSDNFTDTYVDVDFTGVTSKGTVTENTNIKLEVEKKQKNVYFSANGGKFDDGTSWISTTKNKGETLVKTETKTDFPNVSKTGEQFQGWYTAPNGGTQVDITDTPYEVTTNITLYAHFEPLTYVTLLPGEQFNNAIGSVGQQAKKIVFTQEPIPEEYRESESLKKVGVSINSEGEQTEEVIAWFNPDDSVLYITSQDTSKIISFNSNCWLMFNGRSLRTDPLSYVEEIDFGHGVISTSNVTNMSRMFYAFHPLKKLDLSEFDTSNVTNMTEMFHYCNNLNTIIASDSYVVSQADCRYMFSLCESLPHYFAWWDPVGGEYAKSIAAGGNFYMYGKTVTFDANGGTLNNSDGATDVTSTSLVVEKGQPYKTYFGFNKTYFLNNSFPTATNGGKDFIGWYTEPTGGTKVLETDILNSDTDITLYAQWSNLTLKTGTEINELIPDSATSVVFTDATAPTGVELKDLSVIESAVVGWLDDNGVFYISTQITKQKMIFNTDSSAMFKDKTNLTSITFDDYIYTKDVTNMSEMFSGCSNLSTIFAKSDYFITTSVADSTNMFASCTSLPNYKADSVDVTKATAVAGGGYMYMDLKTITLNAAGGKFSDDSDIQNVVLENGYSYGELPVPTREGYKFAGWYTKETDGDEITDSSLVGDISTIYAHWIEKITVLKTGSEIQKVIKDAENSGAVYVYFENNEKVPEHVTVTDLSANNSEAIIGWLSGNEYHISTIGAQDTSKKIIFNEDSSGMFSACSKILGIWFTNVDTSKVTNMARMFSGTTNLNDVDSLTNFDTSNVTDMSQMFAGSAAINRLYLSSFNTSKVTNMTQMFYLDKNLQNIYVKTFDTSSVTESGNMFSGCESLENYSSTNSNDKTYAKSTLEGGYLTTPTTQQQDDTEEDKAVQDDTAEEQAAVEETETE